MDRHAAKEYHAFLHKKLNSAKSVVPNLIWLPLLGVIGFFAFGDVSGALFGFTLGYAVCGILTRIEMLKREYISNELIRHVHEHTDEAEAGKRLAEVQLEVEKAAKRWWP